MTKYCGYPSPKWLEKMILILYTQMTEIRRYAEKKCRKIHTPISEFSPTIRMWYNRIHVYLQLIRVKEGKTKKVRNVSNQAQKHNILHPERLSREELEDGLQLATIRKKELRKQAGELRKAHLRECLMNAQANNKPEKARAIKQRMQRESSKKSWSLIKQTVSDPRSPSILKIQKVVDGEVLEYTEQEDIEKVIQDKCEV
jgi:hypothetical protein